MTQLNGKDDPLKKNSNLQKDRSIKRAFKAGVFFLSLSIIIFIVSPYSSWSTAMTYKGKSCACQWQGHQVSFNKSPSFLLTSVVQVDRKHRSITKRRLVQKKPLKGVAIGRTTT
jgi:hypothetical protein